MCSVRCTVTTVTNTAVIIVISVPCYLVIVLIVVFSDSHSLRLYKQGCGYTQLRPFLSRYPFGFVVVSMYVFVLLGVFHNFSVAGISGMGFQY